MHKFIKPVAMVCLTSLVLSACGGGESEDKTEVKTTVTPNIKIDTTEDVTEPANGSKTFELDLSLSSVTDKNVTFDYTTNVGTATVDDIEVLNGTITVLAGVKNFTLPITILGDEYDENDEVFSIVLSNPVNANFQSGNDTITVTIEDEDEEAEVAFATDTGQVTEGSGLFKIPVHLTTKSQKDVSISYSYKGLATSGQDFTIISQSPIVVPSGEDTVYIEIDFLDDNQPEGGESLIITLQNPTNATLGDVKELTIIIPGDVSLNDTGQVTWYDGTSFTSTNSSAAYPGQDADVGRDVTSPSDVDGHKGFSLTKIDFSGNAVPSDTTNYSCIRDNATGLIWERKGQPELLPNHAGDALKEHINDELAKRSDPEIGTYIYDASHSNYRANNYTYYWFDKNDEINGGSDGANGEKFPIPKFPINNSCAFPNEDSASYTGKALYCTTEDYVENLNLLAYCGYKDWKLPSIKELRSAYDYSAGDSSSNNAVFFPNANTNADYFSSTPSADGTGAAWCLSGETGQARYCNKQTLNHVRLVRGGAQ
jgi:hypothetical protein